MAVGRLAEAPAEREAVLVASWARAGAVEEVLLSEPLWAAELPLAPQSAQGPGWLTAPAQSSRSARPQRQPSWEWPRARLYSKASRRPSHRTQRLEEPPPKSGPIV